MRQVHVAGEKAFVDYSGKRPSVIESATGERVYVELFVGVLGASNLTYAEATPTQRVPDFLGSHVRMFEYFGGVTQMVVPDQLKSAVTIASRSTPVIQRAYADLGRHYGPAIVLVHARTSVMLCACRGCDRDISSARSPACEVIGNGDHLHTRSAVYLPAASSSCSR